jgi:mono/diheme cytochrome c family protein
VFADQCASCHGPDGKAQTPAGKAMKVPAIAGTTLTPEQVVEKLKTIDKHKSVVGKLSDAELMAIAKAIPSGS